MKKAIINLLLYIFLPSIIPMLFTTDVSSKKYTIIMFITSIFLCIFYIIKYKKNIIKNYKDFNKKDLFNSFIIFIIGLSLMISVNYIINYIVLPDNISNNEESLRLLLKNNIIIYSILLCIITPFLEEVVFRIEFKNIIKNKYIYIIITSLLFSLIHNISDTKLIELLYLIPYFILSCSLSLIYYKNNNIIYNTILHSLNNIITFIVVLII